MPKEELSKETMMHLTPESVEVAEATAKESHAHEKKGMVSSKSSKSLIKCLHCPRVSIWIPGSCRFFFISNWMWGHGNKCPKCPGKDWEPEQAGGNWTSAKEFTRSSVTSPALII